jgi:hypothetical protein
VLPGIRARPIIVIICSTAVTLITAIVSPSTVMIVVTVMNNAPHCSQQSPQPQQISERSHKSQSSSGVVHFHGETCPNFHTTTVWLIGISLTRAPILCGMDCSVPGQPVFKSWNAEKFSAPLFWAVASRKPDLRGETPCVSASQPCESVVCHVVGKGYAGSAPGCT